MPKEKKAKKAPARADDGSTHKWVPVNVYCAIYTEPKDAIRKVLEAHQSNCLDNEREREQVLNALMEIIG